MSENDFVIETSGLTKRFGPVTALDALDLQVPRNSIYGFLGPNGSGKTTAMRLLLGLTRPSAGSAKVLGFDTVTDSIEVRRRVGYLPQHPTFYADLTPRETLRYTRGFFPSDADRSVESEIDEVLELVGMRDKENRAAGTLSGGERQRLGIAQAQIHRPELLILDEPASALDPLGRRDVLDIMRRLRETATVFYSTHILDDVQRISDTVAILNQGTRVAQAPIDELLERSGVSFDISIRGETAPVRGRLAAESWVDGVDVREADGLARLLVTVTDERQAERHLLRLMLDELDLDVLSFNRSRSELEDVFVEIVESTA